MNVPRLIASAFILASIAVVSVSASAEVKPPTFRAETIDSKVVIGYGTAIGDVDGDGKLDILLADKKQFVWYKNPEWTRHVIAENLTERDNVCIAARDINGDGKVEIAVGGQWNPGDTVNSGSVHYLIAPEDRTKMWEAVKLHHEPVIHRMRWLKLAEKRFVLVVAPLHGRGNKGGQGAGVKLLAYHVPNDVRAEWRTELLDETFHVTHNFDTAQWDPSSESEEILYLGREGAMLISFEKDKWTRRPFKDVKGGGEIRMGMLSKTAQFIATIEPFHGSSLVFYRSALNRGSANGKIAEIAERIVLDDSFVQAHAIATGDLLGNGTQQIVAGWRNPNRDGKVGVNLYYPVDAKATKWESVVVDDNKMACEDLRIGDLNGDGKLDIVAAGRATHNLKIYWNLGNE
jgi:hypothetical protein